MENLGSEIFISILKFLSLILLLKSGTLQLCQRVRLQTPGKLTTPGRFKLTTSGRSKLTTPGRSKLTTC